MEPIDKPAPVRRADPRAALAWIGERPGRVALVVLLLAAAGACSVLGWLRWQQPFARWSFALLCWAAAALLAGSTRHGGLRGGASGRR